jgi:hypothetical protein
MFPDLSPGKHLLFDNTSIADTYRLARKIHQPRRDPEPVLRPETAWDGQTVTPLHVIYDDARGRWRMWYQAHDMNVEEERKALGKSQYGNVGEPQPIYMCYAESGDGVKWERPKLDVFKHKDGSATNIVFKGYSYAGGNTILHQPEAASAQRYLLVNCDWQTQEVGGIHFAHSPDGIHWTYVPGKPVIHGESDTWNSLAWNAQRGVYMLYMRAWHSAAWGWTEQSVAGRHNTGPWKDNPRRRVAYSESRDLKTWSEPQIILTPDELDTNDFYGFQVFPYADYYLAFLWIYDGDDQETIDVELVWSRDGFHWDRHPERPRFLPRGRAGDKDGFMVIPAQAPTLAGDEMFLYYAGHSNPHDAGEGHTGYGFRTRLRLDGFVSLEAGQHPGTLITRPFTVQSDAIAINAATYTGEIIAELVEPWWYDPTGKAIEGFSAKDFDVFKGDSVSHKLTWRGRSDLSGLRGKRVMLRMAMYHAGIYSVTV